MVIWRSALELANLVRHKEVKPLEILDAVLARLEAVNPAINAFCLVTADAARAAAREAEIAVMKGEPLGLLHGVPVSIKDVLPTRGLTTTGGSRLFEDFVPEHDALAVGRLRAAGTVLFGKTNTSEFSYKALTDNPLFGVTRNPWDPALTPGGSSGGAAAAVASGVGPVALGTDAGGSIRIPAAFCGVYGFKPSLGRVPDRAAFGGFERVGHVGPITRTVRDAAAVLDVIAGGDDRDRGSLPREGGSYLEACDADVKGLNVAWAPDLGYAAVDPRVLAVCENAAGAFEALDCHVEVVNPGWESPEELFTTMIAAQFYAAWSDRLPDAEPLMDAAGGGSIMTMTYLGGERAVPHYNVMGVAKSTLDSSVRYLAWDLGQKNIRVNAVSAGPVRTLAARSIAGFPTMEAIVEERAPLHRPIDADDVGSAGAFLLSDEAANITGTTLYVDSGYHAMGM